MKKLVLLAALSLANICALSAQTVNNSIVVFTEGGEKFYLILNGIKQNTTAETNVKSASLNQANYKAKVIFEQKGIPDCDKTIPMMWEANPVSNTEFVFSIAKDKKGKYKWKFVSQGPVSASTYVVNTNTVSGTAITGNNTNSTDNVSINTSVGGNGGGSSVTTSTTTTTNSGTGTAGANINIGVNGTGLSMNVNVNDGMGGMNTNNGMSTSTSVTSSTTTTTYSSSTTTNGVTNSQSGSTTTVSSGTGSGNVGMNVNITGTGIDGGTSTTTTTTTNGAGSASGACGFPMSSADYADAKKTISAKSFEDTKMSIAKQIADNNCMNVEQIKGIVALFTFEENKLEYAKYCYSKCYDKNNYYKMSDAFTFEASTEELNEYIKNK